MFDSWFDQQRDLAALKSVLAVGHARRDRRQRHRPGVHRRCRCSEPTCSASARRTRSSLVTRASYAVAVAFGAGARGHTRASAWSARHRSSSSRRSSRSWRSSSPQERGTGRMCRGATSSRRSSRSPLYAVRFAPARSTLVHAARRRACSSRLLSSDAELRVRRGRPRVGHRALVVLAALRLGRCARPSAAAHVAAGACAFVVTDRRRLPRARASASSSSCTANHLDQPVGQRRSAGRGRRRRRRSASRSCRSKLVQLFVEPCYYSLCSVSDYAGVLARCRRQLAEAERGTSGSGACRSRCSCPRSSCSRCAWSRCRRRSCWAARHRRAADARAARDPAPRRDDDRATGLVLGYAASTLTGSRHLRYGFARDFLLPALLTGVVAVGSSSVRPLARCSRRTRRRLSPEFAFVILAVVGSACLVAWRSPTRGRTAFPRIESRQLGEVTYTAACRRDVCDVSIAATTTSGRSDLDSGGLDADLRLRQRGRPRFTLYATQPTAGVRLSAAVSECATRRRRGRRSWASRPGSFELARRFDGRNA